MTPFEYFAASVQQFAQGEHAAALASVRQAHAAQPDELLYQDAVAYLERVSARGGQQAIYTESDAFPAFISGGSNIALYNNARSLLANRLTSLAPDSLLDIGTGEGSIIVPVLRHLNPTIHITFCDPALSLLEQALDFARASGLDPVAYPYPIEDMLSQTEGQWDVAVATWSLHNLSPRTRADGLKMLAGRVRRLFVAEFDDASGEYADPLATGRIRHIHDRYRVGLQEYAANEDRSVRLGFLLPVLYGYFAPEGRRSTYEQPIARWEEELHNAGFAIAARTLIYPYWWADSYLIEAERGDQ